MMTSVLLVALGGALGSSLRFLAVSALGAPWATAAVNVAGSFLIGVLFVALAGRSGASALLVTGVLGGFTTFSAFSLDAMKLWQAGQAGMALAYVAVSVLVSLLAVAAGASLARGVLG